MSPTAKSLAYCRKRGWPAAVVERWNPHAMIRQDVWGWMDMLVLQWFEPLDADDPPGTVYATSRFPRILGVQACAGASHAARAAKVRAAPVLPDWIAAGGIAEVWSWAKQGPRGKRKTWQLRRERIVPS